MTTDIRESVSEAYSRAIRSANESSGCCGGPSGVAACGAGYGDEAANYEDAHATSFGCGNPLAFAGVEPGQTVVDLGSGAGLDLLVASDKVGDSGRVIGIDMTDDMIAAARANIERAGKRNVEVRKGYIESLPVDDGSVDWIISNCVINLSPDKPKVFGEIARVLRPGGRFSISDIVAEDLPRWILEHEAAYAMCIAGAVSEADYVAGLRAAGLVDIEVTERRVYTPEELTSLVGSDLEAFGIDPKVLAAGAEQYADKVWSAKIIGRKPA